MYYAPSIAETDQLLRYMTVEDVYNGPTERWRSSSLPSGLEETMRETTARDGPALDLDERDYHIIHQDRYMKGRRAAHTIPPVQYSGFSLDSAYKKEYHGLSDADSPAWSAMVPVATKLAIVLCFPGIPRYHRQVHIRRTDSRVLTRSKLANIVAREIQTFLGKLRACNHDPLQHRGVDVALENLVLVDVQHVSKGSLQPTIGIVSKPN